MDERTIEYLTDAEEEFVRLLVQTGIKKNVAKVLVYLATTRKATSRMIERGVDLRQPEVSIALSRLKALGWVTDRSIPSERKGRPNKEFSLALPIRQILAVVERATRQDMERKLGIVDRLRSLT